MIEVKLRHFGTRVYVNEDMITFISRDHNNEYTYISFPGTEDNFILVEEEIPEVIAKIEKAKRGN